MIDFINVSKRYASQVVLDEVGFRVNPGERVGVVGPNGAGKSTIFGIITRETEEDAGTVQLPRNCQIGHVRQQTYETRTETTLLERTENALPELAEIETAISRLEHAFSDDPAARTDVALREHGRLQTRFEDLGGYTIRARAEKALAGLGFTTTDSERAFSTFSGGWQCRAELARVLVAEPELLLLDEPSNYLDLPAIEWLRAHLESFPGTLLLISHDRYLLNALTNVTLEVANGKVERYPGNYDDYVQGREQRVEQRIAAQRNLDRRRDQAEKFIERFRAKNTKASQVQSRIKMLEKMETVEAPKAIRTRGRIRLSAPPHSGHEIVRLDKIGITYDDSRWVLRNVNLQITKGEKIALVGFNGMGKTTLQRILAGALEPSEGQRTLGHHVVVGYQAQDFTETMDVRATVFDIVHAVAPDLPDQQKRSMLGGFGFSGEAVEKQVAVLSGGEKVRLAFARLLIKPPNFLILDEPTTHLDIQAREALEEALREYTGTLCLVSHDVEFVRHVVDDIIAIGPDGLRRFGGNYDYYRRKLAEESAAPAIAAPSRTQAPVKPLGGAPVSQKEARRLRAEERRVRHAETRQLKRDIAKCEQQIDIYETEQAALLETLSSGDTELNFAELNRRLATIQQEITAYTNRWETLSQALLDAS